MALLGEPGAALGAVAPSQSPVAVSSSTAQLPRVFTDLLADEPASARYISVLADGEPTVGDAIITDFRSVIFSDIIATNEGASVFSKRAALWSALRGPRPYLADANYYADLADSMRDDQIASNGGFS